MLNTMRQRLLLSHILPVLISAPLAGIGIEFAVSQLLCPLLMAGNWTNDTVGHYQQLRFIILSIVIGELILGVFIGWVLAGDTQQLINKVTKAIQRLSEDRKPGRLPERGPEEIRLLLRTVNGLSERLMDLERSRQRILASLVHELGRPIGALQSAVYALQNGATENYEVNRELLNGMGMELFRLHRLLDDIVRFKDNDTLDIDLNLTRIDLSLWLSKLLALWGKNAWEKGLNWETDIPDDLLTLEVDPDRLGQALGNLLSNAIKYAPPGGSVSVSSRREGGEVLIQVSDNGPGIPVEDQEVIFQPFCRGNNRDDQPAGMGLGLSITRDLVKAHNGNIRVESKPGLGSKFTICLPDRDSLEGTEPPPGKELQYEKLDPGFVQLEGIGFMESA